MVRKRRAGDDATNARKRYYRAAERYLKQAQQSIGATASRYRALAEIRLKDAISTYTKETTQRFAKPIQRIANALGVNLSEERETIQQRTKAQEKQIRERAIDQSIEASVKGTKDSESLRQREARAILNSPIGSRVIGATVEIWEDQAKIVTDDGTKIDNKKILPALYDYFKVDNLADLLDTIEDIAQDSLYANPDNEAFYESAKVTIQTYIKNAQNG